MRFWSALIALILLAVLAVGLGGAWTLWGAGSLADFPSRIQAVVAAACIAPAVGLVVWLLAGVRGVAANLFLVAAALAGVAGSAVLWVVILASDF
jgi:hypothetical protein